MKRFLALFLAIMTIVLASMPKSMASVPPAKAVQINYGTTPVTSVTHVRLVDTLARAVQGVLINSAAGAPAFLAVGPSSQPYGTEEDVVLVPAAGTVFIPLPISGGMRVSVKSAAQTLSWGTLNLSLIYY